VGLHASCTTPNSYFGNGTTCLPPPCPITTGACCRGAICSVVASSAACTGPNTRFVPSRAQCNTAGNSVSPCCRADFNKAGGITVQDIYDYLNAWFARDPVADYDGNGAGLPGQGSITSFINAWFAGGC
jgi:hypothetical protein